MKYVKAFLTIIVFIAAMIVSWYGPARSQSEQSPTGNL